MKLNDLYPSRFIKADDCKSEPLVYTIGGVTLEKLGDDERKKPIVSFNETEKCLVLNRTNGDALGQMYGEETVGWIGRQVELYASRVNFGGKMVDCVRIRQPNSARINF